LRRLAVIFTDDLQVKAAARAYAEGRAAEALRPSDGAVPLSDAEREEAEVGACLSSTLA
jgi:hypothetical protein